MANLLAHRGAARLSLQTFSDPRDANDGLAGTPTTAGTYTFTMRLTDYQGDQATQKFTATIDPPLQITSTMSAGTVGVPYSHDLIAQGGAPPYSWSIFANDPLPPGLTLGTTPPDFNNVLTGTPTQAGTFSFTVQVQDSQGNMVNGTLRLLGFPPLMVDVRQSGSGSGSGSRVLGWLRLKRGPWHVLAGGSYGAPGGAWEPRLTL